MTGNEHGPAWLGVGSQRSGTTWFTDLLIQHPEVTLGRSGNKEMHALNADLIAPSGGDDSYLSEFRGLEGKPGEFTPAYLRMMWAPQAAQRLCRPDVIVIALLRDPVERFESAVRLFLARHKPRRRSQVAAWIRDRGVDATWAGMYSTHLNEWASFFDREQMVVRQYENVRPDPTPMLADVWGGMGLQAVPVQSVDVPSRHTIGDSVGWSLDDLQGLRERLTLLYQPEVERLAREWSIDVSLWPNFS